MEIMINVDFLKLRSSALDGEADSPTGKIAVNCGQKFPLEPRRARESESLSCSILRS